MNSPYRICTGDVKRAILGVFHCCLPYYLKAGSLADPETWKLAIPTRLACKLSGSDCLHAKVLG